MRAILDLFVGLFRNELRTPVLEGTRNLRSATMIRETNEFLGRHASLIRPTTRPARRPRNGRDSQPARAGSAQTAQGR